MENLLKELCKIPGASGDEKEICEFIRDKLSSFCDVSIEHDNSIIASIGAKDAEKNIMFEAHADQIGLIVTNIEENGFIKFSNVGGADPRVLYGNIVTIHGTQNLDGVICSTPPHLKTNAKENPLSIDDMFIDIGMSKDKAVKLINIGDKIYFKNGFYKLANNNFSLPASDNRASVCILIKLAEKLRYENLDSKITFLFSSREEVGCIGAKISSYKIKPDEAISVDVTFAKQPGVTSDKYQTLGRGASICIAPILSRRISNLLINICNNKNIAYQTEVYGGKSGTTADVIAVSESGIPCGLVSIPQRYMHSGAEIVNIDDMKKILDLLFYYAKQGGLK